MKNRSRSDIIGQILDVVSSNEGATQTRIMYKAFLSYTQLKQYLAFLIDGGLLDYDLKSQTYRITQKGLKFLTMYNQMGGIMKAIEF
jgi:predicted transcriptional regulator